MAADARLLIAGDWREGGGKPFPVLDPATGETIGSCASADPGDIEASAVAAANAQAELAAVGAYARARILTDAAQRLRTASDRIAQTITIEQGKPLREAEIEVASTAELFEWFGEEGRRAYGRIIPARSPDVRQMVMREAVGPVAAFAPWNFPLSQLARKVGPALAAGCPVVLKPAEETPGPAIQLAEALIESGLPAGALNLLFGDPAMISETLVAHPAIAKLSFTGSVPVGKRLAALAGAHMKRATMELGGHAPVIVTADADIDGAAAALAAAKFRNAGQVCVSPTRFLVEAPAYERFEAGFAAAARALKVGPGVDRTNDMGPLANARRRDAVEALVADAVEQGGRVVTGGERIGNRGSFVAPTVIAGASRDMRAMNEEPFGPIALLAPYDTLDQAIEEANRLPYGLAAYAYAGSAAAIRAIETRVRSGMVTINHLGLALAETPFGGIRDSGYGSEGGAEALDGYLQSKFVTVRINGDAA